MEHFTIRHRNYNATRTSTALKTKPSPSPTFQQKKKEKDPQDTSLVLYRHITKIDKVIRMMRTNGQFASTAGGVIAFWNTNSSGVTASPDWTNFSQEFANYRVRALKLKIFPATVSATPTTGPYQGVMMMSRFWGLLPTTESHISQDTNTRHFSTLQEGQMSTNYLGFQDAQQWTPVGTSISAERTYGFAGITPTGTTGLPASSAIFSYIKEYEVEFLDPY
jgi:hypothetical protein